MPQQIARLMNEISAAREPERRFELVQELYTLLAQADDPERRAGPLEFMLAQGQW
jgi:hypothetical protein